MFQNVLQDLNSHFEDEREALLAALRGQDASLNDERERQLALAKLRRDQRKLQMEDKFDTAALIFSMAQQQETNREAKWVLFITMYRRFGLQQHHVV